MGRQNWPFQQSMASMMLQEKGKMYMFALGLPANEPLSAMTRS